MPRKYMLTLAATALAGFVLLITMQLGPPADDVEGDTFTIGEVDPPDIPMTDLENPDQRRPVGPVEDFRVDYRNSNGQLIKMTADHYEPLPNSVADVTKPALRIYLVPGRRVLTVSADAGRFISPDERPREGTLRGNVVMSLYDLDRGEDRRVQVSDNSPDLKVRVYFLAPTTFNTELGQLDCQGDVHVVGPRIDFQGTGLSLNYNSKLKRIERLVIRRGKGLRFKQSLADSTDSRKTDRPADESPADDGEAQYYSATFARNVHVASDTVDMAGDHMRVLFSLASRGSDDGELIDELSREHAPRIESPRTLGMPTTFLSVEPVPSQRVLARPEPSDVVVTWSGPMVIAPEDDRPQDLAGPDDVKFAMTGSPVHIKTAEHETVDALTVAYLASTGRVDMTGTDAHPITIHAPTVGVFTGRDLSLARATGVGVITGRGSLRSYGSRGLIEEIEPSAEFSSDRPTMPDGMSVQWSEGVDLKFAFRDDGSDRGDTVLKSADFRGDVQVKHPQLDLDAGRLMLATTPDENGRPRLDHIDAFHNVHVRKPDDGERGEMDVRSQKLRIELVADPDGRVHPRRLVADQRVAIREPNRTMFAEHVEVNLTTRAARQSLDPAAINDRDPAFSLGDIPDPEDLPTFDTPLTLYDVEPEQEAVPADVVHQPDAAPQPRRARRRQELTVLSVKAEKDIRVVMQEPELRVAAHRMVADGRDEKLDIFGSDEQPAVLVRDDGVLRGRHITVLQARQTIGVEGPGQLEFFSVADAQPVDEQRAIAEAVAKARAKASGEPISDALAEAIAKAEAAREAGDDPRADDEPVRKTRVLTTWTESMSFDNRTSIARFYGNVESRGRIDNDTMRLAAGDLVIDFRTPRRKTDTLIASPFDERKDDDRPTAAELFVGDRAINHMIAHKDVVFEADTWADKPGGKRLTSMRVTGPLVNFLNKGGKQLLTVDGEGTMALVDRREPRDGDGGTQRGVPEVAMSGRGDTLFKWKGSLRFDAIANDMTMHKAVQMAHRDAGTGDVVRMDCTRLVADFAEVGGLGVWISGNTPQPRIKAINAMEHVQIATADRTVTTSHLSYDAPSDTVYLTTREGDRLSQVSEGAHSMTAEAFKWDLEQDKIEIEKPGASRSGLGG